MSVMDDIFAKATEWGTEAWSWLGKDGNWAKVAAGAAAGGYLLSKGAGSGSNGGAELGSEATGLMKPLSRQPGSNQGFVAKDMPAAQVAAGQSWENKPLDAGEEWINMFSRMSKEYETRSV